MVSKKRAPSRAFLAQWSSAVYTALVSFALTLLIGRVFGPSGFGAYSYILTLASFVFLLQDGGYKSLLYREKTMTSPGIRPHVEHLLGFALGHALLITLIGLAIVYFLDIPHRWELAAALLCFSTQAVVVFASSELKAKGDFIRDALWKALARSLSALCIAPAVFLLPHRPGVVFSAWALGLGACIFFYRPIPLPRPKFAGYFIKNIRGPCLAFLLVDAATTVYYKCDILLLQHLTRSAEEVGQYAAAYRFLDGIVLLAAPLGAIWFRELRLLAADSPEFKSRLTQMGLMLLGAALTILALGMVFKTRILHFTFGADYASAAELLPWLLAALIFVLPNTVLTQAAIAKNRERLYAVAAGIGALLNIGLNWMLIPQFGGLGAAWSTIATEGILGVFLLWGLWRRADKGGEV